MAVSERPQVGLECKLYRNTATHASPTWSEITRAINVTLSLTKNEADASSRVYGWKSIRTALKDLELTFTYRKKQGTDTVFDALQAAFIAGTAIEYFVADGSSADSGTQGARFYGELTTMNVAQDLESTEEVEFTVKHTYAEQSGVQVAPDWYEVP